MKTHIITSGAEWRSLKDAWNTLLAQSDSASTVLTFDWLNTWWHYYANACHGSLRVITVSDSTGLIAALPLYLQRTTHCLRFLGTGESEAEETCPDYLDLLMVRDVQRHSVVEKIWEAIGSIAWDQIELLDMPQGSKLVLASPYAPHPRGRCPIAELSRGFDAYLSALSANTRQRARRLLRAAERSGARLEIATPGEVQKYADELVRLHEARWQAQGRPGCFAAGRFTAFHKRLMSEWIPDGRALLARLIHSGSTYAVLYGFITNGTFEFYQSGVMLESEIIDSPGTTAHLLLMKALADRGVSTYDFLRGSRSYKERLATGYNALVKVHAWRVTPQAISRRCANIIRRASLRVTRKLFK